jgi:hypothetical protein
LCADDARTWGCRRPLRASISTRRDFPARRSNLDSDKGLITQHFQALTTNASADLDRQLLEIRTKLKDKLGPDFSFYDKDLKGQWLPRTAEDEPSEVIAFDTIAATAMLGRENVSHGPP